MMEVVVTTGAISRAKLQSYHHHQQTNTKLFTGWMLFLLLNQQCESNTIIFSYCLAGISFRVHSRLDWFPNNLPQKRTFGIPGARFLQAGSHSMTGRASGLQKILIQQSSKVANLWRHMPNLD